MEWDIDMKALKDLMDLEQEMMVHTLISSIYHIGIKNGIWYMAPMTIYGPQKGPWSTI